MAKLDTPFNAAEVAPKESRDYTVLPAGMYTVEITDCKVRELKSGNGTGMEVEYTVIDPQQYAKRKIFQNINLKHSNADAERIGQSELSALCHAVGIPVLEDTDQLFQRILHVRTRIRRQDGYEPKAEVTGCEAAGAAPPAGGFKASAARPAAAATPSAGPKAPPPWQKKAA